MTLARLKAALEEATGAPFAAYAWQQTPDEDAWGIVTVDGEAAAVWADDHQQLQAHRGHVSLFTRVMDEMPGLVQQALDSLEISWNLEAADYETDTRLLHYTWGWRDWEG